MMQSPLCTGPLSFLSEHGQLPLDESSVPGRIVTGRGKT